MTPCANKANIAMSSKLRAIVEKTEMKLKARKKVGSYSKINEQEHKNDEITSMLRKFSNRI